MEEKKITPEEQLLRIIEDPRTEKSKIPPPMKATYGNIKNLAAFFKNLHIQKDFFKRINLQTANKMILVICGIFTIYWLFDFIKIGNMLNKKLEKVIVEAQAYEPQNVNTAPLPEINIADAIMDAKRRNIYTFTLLTSIAQQSPIEADIAAMINSLKLVGIIWGENPQAMIENTKEQKTYLLNKNDMVDQLTIKNILRDKVILIKDDKEWELR
jgi:hypothetical protein